LRRAGTALAKVILMDSFGKIRDFENRTAVCVLVGSELIPVFCSFILLISDFGFPSVLVFLGADKRAHVVVAQAFRLPLFHFRL
jgi:hypothetical protein